jgi:hypothetical protein
MYKFELLLALYKFLGRKHLPSFSRQALSAKEEAPKLQFKVVYEKGYERLMFYGFVKSMFLWKTCNNLLLTNYKIFSSLYILYVV